MKLYDLTDHDHPLSWYTWSKEEVEFINARVRTAYENGLEDAAKVCDEADKQSQSQWPQRFASMIRKLKEQVK